MLPVVDSAVHTQPPAAPRSRTKRTVLVGAGVLALLALARSGKSIELNFDVPECLRSLTTFSAPDEAAAAESALPELGVPEKIQRRWGQYSPYYPAGEYVPPPDGCVIDQVNIVRDSVSIE